MEHHRNAASKTLPVGLAATALVVAVIGVLTLVRIFGYAFGVPGIVAVAFMCACAIAAGSVAMARHRAGSRRLEQ